MLVPTSGINTETLSDTTPTEEANLAYYIEAQRLDPIFAIEGTDPVKLRAAIHSLLDEIERIGSIYQPQQRQAIEHTLYPNEFLKLLPDLEEARQTMFKDPTVPNAKRYHALLSATAGQYAAGARAVAANVESVTTKIPSIGHINGVATTTDIAPKLRKVAMLALQQKEKEQARFLCLTHGASNCKALATLRAERNAKLATVQPQFAPPSKEINQSDALSKQILPLVSHFDGLSETIYAIPSTCTPGNVAYLREYYLTPLPGQTARKQDIINDTYFYDLPKQFAREPNLPLLKSLTKAGITVLYQSMGNLYMCLDSGFDVSNISRIIGTVNFIKNKRAQTEEEKKLLALPFVQKSTIGPYVLREARQNTPGSDALVERYLEGSADLDQVLMGAYNDNAFLVTWDKTQNPVQYEYLTLVRNFASTLLLMGNPTFVSEPISLFSNSVPQPLGSTQLRSYLTDVSKQYTDAEIMAQFKTSYELEVGSGLRKR